MPTVQGKEYSVARATKEQSEKIKQYLKNKALANSLYKANAQILEELRATAFGKALVIDFAIEEDGSEIAENRTMILGEPTGGYIIYKKLDFISDAKTTKKDLEALKEREENN